MNNNKKIVQDIKHTGDEAARLLKELEKSSTAQSGTQKSENVRSILEDPNKVNRLDSNANSNTLVGPAIVVSGLIIFLAVAANLSSTNNSSNTSTSESNSPVAINKDQVMSSTQRSFYKQTLKNAREAVLIREHKSAIRNLEKLKRGEYLNLSDVDRGLVNNTIIQAKKKIKYLDQPGKHSYWEGENYGIQWFDKDTDNHIRVFFAYSKKCTNPIVTFRVSKESGSSNYKSYEVKPKTNISTLHVPFLFDGNQYINVLNFDCN